MDRRILECWARNLPFLDRRILSSEPRLGTQTTEFGLAQPVMQELNLFTRHERDFIKIVEALVKASCTCNKRNTDSVDDSNGMDASSKKAKTRTWCSYFSSIIILQNVHLYPILSLHVLAVAWRDLFFDFYYMFHAPTTEIWTFELKSYSRPPIWEPVDCWVRTAGLGWKLNLARFGTLDGQENFAQWFIHTWQSIVIREID